MTDPATAPATEQREYTTTRTFDAPREVVFRAWTEPEQNFKGLSYGYAQFFAKLAEVVAGGQSMARRRKPRIPA